MLKALKAGWVLAAGIAGTAFLCPLCGGGVAAVGAQRYGQAFRSRILPPCASISPG